MAHVTLTERIGTKKKLELRYGDSSPTRVLLLKDSEYHWVLKRFERSSVLTSEELECIAKRLRKLNREDV